MQAKFCKIWVVLLLEQQKREREDAPRSYKRLASFRKITAFFVANYRRVFFTTDRCIHVKLQKKKKNSIHQS